MLPPCFLKALSGSPVPPGEGPGPQTSLQRPAGSGPATITLPAQPLPGLLFSAPCRSLGQGHPPWIPPFLRLFSSLEAQLTVRVCAGHT